jgi:hypothetical protein
VISPVAEDTKQSYALRKKIPGSVVSLALSEIASSRILSAHPVVGFITSLALRGAVGHQSINNH